MTLRNVVLVGSLICALHHPAAAQLPAKGVEAFLVPWDTESALSLRAHGATISTVIPAWISVTGSDHLVSINPDPAGHDEIRKLSRRPRLKLMVQNAFMGSWDGAGIAALLAEPQATANLFKTIDHEIIAEKADGVVFDFENLPVSAQSDLLVFLGAAQTHFQGRGLTIAVAAPVENSEWDLKALAKVADEIILMAYDQHFQGGEAGPIAATAWFNDAVKKALIYVPLKKATVAVASYAYDWAGDRPTRALSISQAENIASEAGVTPFLDPASGNRHFAYMAGGVAHEVWMQGSEAVYAQIRLSLSLGVTNIAIWRLGTEDSQMWK